MSKDVDTDLSAILNIESDMSAILNIESEATKELISMIAIETQKRIDYRFERLENMISNLGNNRERLLEDFGRGLGKGLRDNY